MDWLKIKTEYITTDTSYRKLAEKYGVRVKTICERSKAEGWIQAREQHRHKTETKMLEKISNQQARQAAKVSTLADKLLIKLDKAIDELDLKVITHRVKTEDTDGNEETTEWKVAEPGGTVDRAGLRQLTAALQQLQEIKGEITDLDRQEQEARIATLKKNAKEEDKTPKTITVRLGGLEKYAK